VATSVPCPENCGRLLNVKRSRRGKFLACPGYPKCRGTLNLPSCPHESKGGKLCGLPMTEPGPNGTMICREHPQVALAPPPKAARGEEKEEKEAAEAEPVKAKAGKAAPRKARKPRVKKDAE
jgi:ssDNA-binding Zn-finger/Zn-ribbon topoisomerase 1